MLRRVLVVALAAMSVMAVVAPAAMAYTNYQYFNGTMYPGGSDTTAAGPPPNETARPRDLSSVYWTPGSPAACMTAWSSYTNGSNGFSGSCDGSESVPTFPSVPSTSWCAYDTGSGARAPNWYAFRA